MMTTIPPGKLRPWLSQQIDRYQLGFSLEITAAVVLKFLLLWALWWLFFAGPKQAVDGPVIADKLFGISTPPATDKEFQ
ncbi:MAG: hypothetical protein HOP34_15010 [Methylococcaceae bacterium]|nr:hypothetical protein [Methylococcaceae bacterium]